MEPTINISLYCRFCAQLKSLEKLFHIDLDLEKYQEISSKLVSLNMLYVNISDDDKLPKTICFVCYQSLNKAHEFLDCVKEAQKVLNGIFSSQELHNDVDENKTENQPLTKIIDPICDINIKEQRLDTHSKIENQRPEVNNQPTTVLKSCEINIQSMAYEGRLNRRTEVNNQSMAFDRLICLQNKKPEVSTKSAAVEDSLICLQNQRSEINNQSMAEEDRLIIENIPEELDETSSGNSVYDGADVSYVFDDIQSNIPPEELDETSSDISIYDEADVSDVFDDVLNSSTFSATDLKDFKNIKLKTWKEFPWICLHCEVQFESVKVLRLHSKEVHNKCYAFNCGCYSFNDKYRNDYSNFFKHIIKIHFPNLRKNCYYCYEDLQYEKLEEHIESHYLRERLACTACGEVFDHKESLTEHINKYVTTTAKPRRNPDTAEDKDLTCKLCSKLFKNQTTLTAHLKKHKNSDEWMCDLCGKKFNNKYNLQNHMLSHNPILPHICKICNKLFKTTTLLRSHVSTHSSDRPHQCNLCKKTFKKVRQLNSHKIIHSDIMPFQCQYCQKKFNFKTTMTIHERQHTGAKPYGCDECSRQFVNWSNYYKHMKRKHDINISKKKVSSEGTFARNPKTGHLLKWYDQDTEEWTSKVMAKKKQKADN